MKKGFYAVMSAQFFSSLADNALYIAAIKLIAEISFNPQTQNVELPFGLSPELIKFSFAAAYVIFAPFMGAVADSYPKGRVMFFTNIIKVVGCLAMYFYASIGGNDPQAAYIIAMGYGLVGFGAAAYSPAKYGIVTELLPPEDLVKGNSWIEGLTIISIVLGILLGGTLLTPLVSSWLLSQPWVQQHAFGANTPSEAAIFIIILVYVVAALLNLIIPKSHIQYKPQSKNLLVLTKNFAQYVAILWKDPLAQISLAVTTLFWGAGVTFQMILLDWGRVYLGYGVEQVSILMGITACGTIIGAILAGKFVSLKNAIKILPLGVMMGIVATSLTFSQNIFFVYFLLILFGGLSGFFVVPINALLQHRGHVLLSAGHSIAVQNFNEQLSILIMVFLYYTIKSLGVPVNICIYLFGGLIAFSMLLIIRWSKNNLSQNPHLLEEIGSHEFGKHL